MDIVSAYYRIIKTLCQLSAELQYVDTISVICNKHRGHRQRNTEPHGLRQLSRKFKDIVSVKFIPTRKLCSRIIQNQVDILSA